MSKLSYIEIKPLVDQQDLNGLKALQVEGGETLLQWGLRWMNPHSSQRSTDVIEKQRVFTQLLQLIATNQDYLLEQLNIPDASQIHGQSLANLFQSIAMLPAGKQIAIFTAKDDLLPKRYVAFMQQLTFDILVREMQKNRDESLQKLLQKASDRTAGSMVRNNVRLQTYLQVPELVKEINDLIAVYEARKDKASFIKGQILTYIHHELVQYVDGEWGFSAVRMDFSLYFSQLRINQGKFNLAFPALSRMNIILQDLTSLFSFKEQDLSREEGKLREVCAINFDSLNEEGLNDAIGTILSYLDEYPDFIEMVLAGKSGKQLLAMMALKVAPRRFASIMDLIDSYWLSDKLNLLSLRGCDLGLLQNALSTLSGLNKRHESYKLLKKFLTDNSSRILKSIQKLPPKDQLKLLLHKDPNRDAVALVANHCPELLPEVVSTVLQAIRGLSGLGLLGLDMGQLAQNAFSGRYNQTVHALLLRYVYQGGDQGMKVLAHVPKETDIQRGLNKIYYSLIELRGYRFKSVNHTLASQRLGGIHRALEEWLDLRSGFQTEVSDGSSQNKSPVERLREELFHDGNVRVDSDLEKAHIKVKEILDSLNSPESGSVSAVSVVAARSRSSSRGGDANSTPNAQ